MNKHSAKYRKELERKERENTKFNLKIGMCSCVFLMVLFINDLLQQIFPSLSKNLFFQALIFAAYVVVFFVVLYGKWERGIAVFVMTLFVFAIAATIILAIRSPKWKYVEA